MPVLVALAAMAIPQAAFAYAPTGPAGPVELSQPWAVPAPAGGDASVMFTLHNFGDVPDNLIHATCAIAESTELVGPARPGAAPAQLNQIVLGPAQQIALAPDSIHLVLHHLYAATQPGQTLHCTATFSRSGERLFEAEVRQSAPPPAPPI
jgi:copper(I)-binding protein